MLISGSGAFVCERVDEQLLNVVRRDLDPASRDAIFAAQRQTRREEGTTAERRVAECALDSFFPLGRANRPSPGFLKLSENKNVPRRMRMAQSAPVFRF